ncbi:MAG TPA: PKD domain-containing protein [Tepidisphaeraceae bacterium]|jgi:uncharacterized delta-60 repeat protein
MFRRRALRTPPQSSCRGSDSVQRETNSRRVLARAIAPLLHLELLEARQLLTTVMPGDPDPGFNGGNLAMATISGGSSRAVAVDPTDGSIIVAGDDAIQAALVRFKADGSGVDTGFGTGGEVKLNIGIIDEIDAIKILSDGKILVAGHSPTAGLGEPYNSTVFVAELNADGTPVTDFASTAQGSFADGIAFLPNLDGDVKGLAVRANGEILVAINSGGHSGGQIAQLQDPVGITPVQYDTSWGSGGVATNFLTGAIDLKAIALQTLLSGEYVIAAGDGPVTHGVSVDDDVFVSRLKLDGSGEDLAFGPGGFTTSDLGQGEAVAGVAVDSQDRVYLAVGHLKAGDPDTRLSVYRYTSGGSQDTVNWHSTADAQAQAGDAQIYDPGHSFHVAGIAIDANDLPVVSATYFPTDNSAPTEIGLARFTSSGTPDASFSAQGALSGRGIDDTDITATGVAIMADGRIVVGGENGTGTAYLAARYGSVNVSTPPTANAGSDQSVNENQTAILNASGSSGTGTLNYAWDLDDNGSYETSTGTTPTINFTQDLPGVYTVGLQVTDSSTSLTATDTVNITFVDLHPTANAGANQTAVRQTTVNFSGSATAVAGDAIVTYEWDLDNNGTYETVGQNASTVFTSNGTYTVKLRVTDNDGDQAVSTTQVSVVTAAIVGGNLVVGGTGLNDVIAVRTTPTPGQLKVLFSNVEVGRYTPAPGGHVIVYAGAGADSVDVGGTVNASEVYGGTGNDTLDGGNGNDLLDGGDDNDVINGHAGNDTAVGGNGADSVSNDAGDDQLDGGAGNDTLKCGGGADQAHGGAGNDSILGGTGNDSLFGDDDNDTIDGNSGDDFIDGGNGSDDLDGSGGSDIVVGQAGADQVQGGSDRDLLIGGAGADNILGNADEDILIAGTTDHDNNLANLQSIRTTWNGSAAFSTRVATLAAGLLNPNTAVHDDGVPDTLTGGSASDWFLFNNDSSQNDVVIDLKPSDSGVDVDP